jgi:hypothetical protein
MIIERDCMMLFFADLMASCAQNVAIKPGVKSRKDMLILLAG